MRRTIVYEMPRRFRLGCETGKLVRKEGPLMNARFNNHRMVTDGHKVLFVIGNKKIERLFIGDSAWTEMPDLPLQRSVCGFLMQHGNDLQSLWLFTADYLRE